MTISEHDLNNLSAHCEWSGDLGFSLVIFYGTADDRQQTLAHLETAGIKPEIMQPHDVTSLSRFFDMLSGAPPPPSGSLSPLWLDLSAPASTELDHTTLYARLNERRHLMEKHINRPLILHLAPDQRQTHAFTHMAPDLVHIRAMQIEPTP